MYMWEKMAFFGMPSLEVQDATLKRRLSSASSVEKKSQASPSVPADVGNSNDDDDD